MNRKIVSFISASIILLLVIFLYEPMVEVTMGFSTTTIFVDPSTSTAVVGQTFSVSIDISDVVDLYGWEFKLGWNSTLLEVLNVTEGPFLKQGGAETFFWPIINNTAGYILTDCTLLGDAPGVNGNGTLATIEFYVEVQGESVLDLYNTTLISSLEQPIAHTSVDGYVVAPHDVAVINITVSPTTVLQGQCININVTVENQGAYAESFDVTAYYDSTVIETQPVSLDIGASTILSFTWNTTGVDKGDYTISAEASVVPGEMDTTDNTKAADGMVTVLSPEHDVAIKDVTASKPVIGQGFSLSINVTAKNFGNFTENFNVIAYANATIIQTENITLASGDSTTIAFTWNTTGVAYGYYIISAVADTVPGETDTADNTYIDGWVEVRVWGDVNGNGVVDLGDVGKLILIYSGVITSPYYPPYMPDLNGNGEVDLGDVGKIILLYSGLL